MFDLTKEIKLNPEMQKKYAISRAVLHIVFILSVAFVLYRILFPIVPLDFSMSNQNSSKNTLVSPRMEQSGQFPEKRFVNANEIFTFNANPVGEFSKISVTITLDKNEKSINGTPVKIRRSYQAFFYPKGEPVGFKNGTLLSTPDGAYYIVSNGLLRKFSSTDVILQLGYPKSSFISVSQDDLKYNKKGAEIRNTSNYPDDTTFLVDEKYYQLKNQKLAPFVSARAFLSQFDQSGAIAKKSDFLSLYPITETYLGFADGTLASSSDSVFIISEGRDYPVETAETFLAMGFDFENVIELTQDELNAHLKQKQFTHNDPHPNGIVFLDKNSNEYYIIENGFKKLLATEAIAKTYTTKQKPIIVDSKASELESSCALRKKLLIANEYTCHTSLLNLTSAIGNDYKISTKFSNDVKIKNINATFSTPLKWTSLKNSASKIKARILAK